MEEEEEKNKEVVDSSSTTNLSPFSIELFLREAKIADKRIPQYTKFLETLGVEENKLHLLTRNELKEFAEEYKKDHSEFVLVPLDAAAIAETAANWGSKEEKPNKRAKIGPYRKSDKYFENSAFHVVSATCPTELQKHKQEYGRAFLARDLSAFTNNFMDALKIVLNNTSPFYSRPIYWTKREQTCAERLIKYIYLLEQNEQHISSIFVGMKGVGKTTLVQKICIITGALSDTLFITYFDISSNAFAPVDILNEALRFEGDTAQFEDIRDLLDYVRNTKGKKLLTVIDEAHKYYVKRTDSPSKQESSMQVVRQLYELGIARGSCCILCGSSSKLVDLALQRSITETAKELLVQYISYGSLNDQKFTPMVLPLLEREDLPRYLQFLGLPYDEKAVSYYWIRSGGSLRFIIKNEELTTNIPLLGPTYAILVWLYNQQDDKQDVNKVKKIPLEVFERQKKYWIDNEILQLPPSILYELIDECTLSTTWNDFTLMSIGFGHPGQYLKLQQLDKVPGELTMEEKNWLLDPKTYGEKLEWLVESCVQNKPITKKFVLCLNNKPSDCKDPHEDIFLMNWDPLGKHSNVVMKLYPDDYGVDMIKVSVDAKGNIELYQSQMKLGGSGMSPGNESKQDTVNHMLSRFKNAPKIRECLETRVPSQQRATITVANYAYITRQLSGPSKKLITDTGICLYDRKDMFKNVWSKAVVDYANSISLKWIVEF